MGNEFLQGRPHFCRRSGPVRAEHREESARFSAQLLDEMQELLDVNETEHVVIVVGKRQDPGLRVRLTPRSGPLGELLNQSADGVVVAAFNRTAVRKWFSKVRPGLSPEPSA